MKNGLLIWNVVLTLVAGYLLIAQLRGKSNASDGVKQASGDSMIVNKQFRIAFFEMDSIEANWEEVKAVKNELNKKEEEITVELDRLDKNIKQKIDYYQRQAQAGALNEAQQMAASQELKAMDEQMRDYKTRKDQEYSELYTRKMKETKTKIEDFLKEYNKTRDYSYIVSYEQGLFYYRDSIYNITEDVIRGLNDKYKKPASKKE